MLKSLRIWQWLSLFLSILTLPTLSWAQPPSGATWTLKFEDNFNGTSLDQTKWSQGFGWGPVSGAFNETTRPENVVVSNGTLKIEMECDNGYKSGAINSRNKFIQKYGYWEARIKVPAAAAGLLPAFWAKFNNDQWPPELDIMEIFGSNQSAQFTVHWGSSSATHQQSGQAWNGGDLSTAFHTFGCEWDPNYIKWYVDGQVRRTYARPDADAFLNQWNAVSDGIYMMLNVHAANQPWTGGTLSCVNLPRYMEVDWVRVYQKSASTGGTSTTYEAENATKAGGVQTASGWTGASNSAYVDYPGSFGSGVYTQWTVNASTAGTHTLEFRYTNGSGANRPLQLQVNGITVNSSLAFNGTTSWGTWATVTVSNVALNSGSNTVRLTALNNVGPDIDFLKVTKPAGARLIAEEGRRDPSFSVEVYPNPITERVQVLVKGTPGETYHLKMLDMAGRADFSRTVQVAENGEQLVPITMNKAHTGMYLLQITDGQGRQQVRRILKE
ncbi:T9SS C-terminal target domain-containing protein [Fibrisoma montanum]|uniref:T9SS C-terminal target domain-containing protein n=1 Tax=Fibrisoma montanum TaxID=2305895 RepID=A0A418LXD7_9BACT|nr:family 16 glycosylhydrolase [Fibrisoma montanum]RIV17976.1 T9SS C-terminal target domain-containing protein [Fibrisoma montanum]